MYMYIIHLRDTATQYVTLKVYNDVAVELSMAVLKYIKKTKNPAEVKIKHFRFLIKEVSPLSLLSIYIM